RDEDRARRREGGEVLHVNADRRTEDLTALPLLAQGVWIWWSPRGRRHCAQQRSQDQEQERDERQRMDHRPVQNGRAPCHGATEESTDTHAEGPPPRQFDARVPQRGCPLDRRRPLWLGGRPRRPVVDALLLLAPAARECEPGVWRRRGCRDFR